MRRLVNAAQRDPLTVQVASGIVGGALRSTALMAAAIRSWLAAHWRFQADPVDVELLRTVPEMLRDVAARGVVQADCDDAAVLSAALGKAVGMRARFVVLAFGGPRAPYSHVYTELLTPTGWQNVDVTRPPSPAPPSRYAMVEV
jgi:transglutaminase-like putative cysteine protease